MNELINEMSVTTKVKHTLIDYYYNICNGRKPEHEIRLNDLGKINISTLKKMRNVGQITIKEIEFFFTINQIDFTPYKKPVDKRVKKKLYPIRKRKQSTINE